MPSCDASIRSMRSVTAVVWGFALLLSGCPDSTTPPFPPVVDAGPVEIDAGPYVDTDGDGLCDLTEQTRRTDPEDPDTDGDGFTDFVESAFGYDPRLPGSPDRNIVVTLRENAASVVQVPISVSVRGGGEDFTGAFEGLPARDLGNLTAAEFYDTSIAVAADPEENVALMEEDAERFRGVVGTTVLFFEVRLAYDDSLDRRCLRAFPFRYNVKRSDGRIVAQERFLLVILPQGDTIATGEWCAPPEPCT